MPADARQPGKVAAAGFQQVERASRVHFEITQGAAAGIVSAKDVVRRVLALGLDAQVITVGDILWSRLPAAHVTDCVMETVERMSTSEGDTLLVLDAHGEIAGIVALDDVLFAYASALAWSPVH